MTNLRTVISFLISRGYFASVPDAELYLASLTADERHALVNMIEEIRDEQPRERSWASLAG